MQVLWGGTIEAGRTRAHTARTVFGPIVRSAGDHHHVELPRPQFGEWGLVIQGAIVVVVVVLAFAKASSASYLACSGKRQPNSLATTIVVDISINFPQRELFSPMPHLRRLIQYGYAPVFFLVTIAAAISVTQNQLSRFWLILLLLVAIGASMLVERLLPYDPEFNRPQKDAARDGIHAFVNECVSVGGVLILPLLAFLTPDRDIWPTKWPIPLQLALAIIVADFGITLAHFASHKVPALWRFHAVHHSVKRLYGFNGLMKHPIHQIVEMTAAALPLLLLGVPQDVAYLLAFATSIQLLLQHSNVDIRVGYLANVWAVAPVHRLHHVNSAVDGDCNFGLFTTIWDRILGTFRPQSSLRLTASNVGLEDRENYPSSYFAQLVEPFRQA